jgi:hypothetical protein
LAEVRAALLELEAGIEKYCGRRWDRTGAPPNAVAPAVPGGERKPRAPVNGERLLRRPLRAFVAWWRSALQPAEAARHRAEHRRD